MYDIMALTQLYDSIIGMLKEGEYKNDKKD